MFAAVHESGYGTNPKCRHVSVMSAIGGKAEDKCSMRVLPVLTHLRHAPLWISAVHIGHRGPFRCWQFETLRRSLEIYALAHCGDVSPVLPMRPSCVGLSETAGSVCS